MMVAQLSKTSESEALPSSLSTLLMVRYIRHRMLLLYGSITGDIQLQVWLEYNRIK